MLVPMTRLATSVAFLAAAAALPGVARAQVPEGYAVVATHTEPGGATSGQPGLFLVPLAPAGGPMRKVTKLPPELATDGLGRYGQGAWAVSIRSADGAVIVSTISGALAPGGAQGHLFVLFLNGDVVDPVRSKRIVLGTAINVARAWHTLLPDGRILVGAGGDSAPFASGPMANHYLAIVDTSGDAFTLLPNPPLPARSVVGGLAIDPTGRFAYYLLSDSFFQPLTDAHLRRYELATGQDCLIATWIGQTASGVHCDDDGTIRVGAADPVAMTHFVHTVRPNGCGSPATVTTVQSSLPLLPAGLDLDRASGRFAATSFRVVAGATASQFNALTLIDPSSGAVSVIATAPAGGWGAVCSSSVAVNNSIESYGARSDDPPNHHWFENFPNPGGDPTIGNQGFSLTMRAAPNAPLLSALWLSLGRGSTNLLGVEVLVDLASTVGLVAPSGRSVPVRLPIPNAPALRGVVITAQSVHVDSTGPAASRGLTLTVR